jgi:hypothetical protein
MKKRYLYALLFAIPGFFISLIISFAVFGVATGFLWLYVFGDNPWPAVTEKVLPILMAGTFLCLWLVLTVAGFNMGKKLEVESGLNKRHLIISVLLTLAPILMIAMHQFNVGNLEPQTDSDSCSDFCREKGYPASGLPPKSFGKRDCICYDSGQEALRAPLDRIISGN